MARHHSTMQYISFHTIPSDPTLLFFHWGTYRFWSLLYPRLNVTETHNTMSSLFFSIASCLPVCVCALGVIRHGRDNGYQQREDGQRRQTPCTRASHLDHHLRVKRIYGTAWSAHKEWNGIERMEEMKVEGCGRLHHADNTELTCHAMLDPSVDYDVYSANWSVPLVAALSISLLQSPLTVSFSWGRHAVAPSPLLSLLHSHHNAVSTPPT